MLTTRNPTGHSAILLCIFIQLNGAWAADYLSNLGNRWIDPGNPTCNCSIGDIHVLLPYGPFAVQFFTGIESGEVDATGSNYLSSEAIGTNSPVVAGFALNSVTFEFIGGHAQPWTDVSVQLYQQTGGQALLVGQLANPAVNPRRTQWPEFADPQFCTTYVDYFPSNGIVLEPASEYSIVLTDQGGSSLGLLFSLSSNFVSAADWRMGATTTHNPWAAGEFLKVAIAATGLPQTNSLVVAPFQVRLSANRVGTNLVVTWPKSGSGCRLYALPSLQATAWSPVSNRPVMTNDNYEVSLPLSGPSCLFRLQGP